MQEATDGVLNVETAYEYDKKGVLQKTVKEFATGGTALSITYYEYDAKGLVVRITEEQDNEGDGIPDYFYTQFDFEYDTWGNEIFRVWETEIFGTIVNRSEFTTSY